MAGRPSISGTARVLTCPPARRLLARGDIFREPGLLRRRHRLRLPVPQRADLRHGLPLDDARRRALQAADGAAARPSTWRAGSATIRRSASWLWNFLDIWLAQDRRAPPRRCSARRALPKCGEQRPFHPLRAPSSARRSRHRRPRPAAAAAPPAPPAVQPPRRDDLGPGLAAGILRDDPADAVLRRGAHLRRPDRAAGGRGSTSPRGSVFADRRRLDHAHQAPEVRPRSAKAAISRRPAATKTRAPSRQRRGRRLRCRRPARSGPPASARKAAAAVLRAARRPSPPPPPHGARSAPAKGCVASISAS